MAVYYATKAYVLSFSEAIAEELHGSGVTVTTLAPGPTATGFQARAAMEESKLVKGRRIMDAGTVARAGIDAMLAGRPLVIPGVMNRVQALTPRLLPRRLVPGIVRRAQARAGS
jgi:short-subunit dehydrogenase